MVLSTFLEWVGIGICLLPGQLLGEVATAVALQRRAVPIFAQAINDIVVIDHVFDHRPKWPRE
ncbi:MAG: hypothetical protein CMC08_02665 [Flavobacteriaceae bacterium]|nr:hypothetical protein [Flavobacteriaceae bacterium]